MTTPSELNSLPPQTVILARQGLAPWQVLPDEVAALKWLQARGSLAKAWRVEVRVLAELVAVRAEAHLGEKPASGDPQ